MGVKTLRLRWRWRWRSGLAASLFTVFILVYGTAILDYRSGLSTMVLLATTSSQNGANLIKEFFRRSVVVLNQDDESFCLSKHESLLYRRNKPQHKPPSAYLLSRLQKYQSLHRNCGPKTHNYNQALNLLFNPNPNITNHDCKYLIWLPINGLANRLLSIVSSFLYAILTDRILLIHQPSNMNSLFCEPFENTTWLLPSDFPFKNQFQHFCQAHPSSYGNIIFKNRTMINYPIPALTYLHLTFDYNYNDMLFFCDEYQIPLQKVPWLVLRSDQYFVPSLFLMPKFELELRNLFPEKETVFHHLGRFLFNPSNVVWGIVKKYYWTNLASADERIGFQIRDFKTTPMGFNWIKDRIFNRYLPFANDESNRRQITDICNVTTSDKHMMDRIVSCLPKVVIFDQNPKQIAVLLTSLSSRYYNNISELYHLKDSIKIYQPSHEENEHNEKLTHNMKAWAEIYLLSMMDVLVTSPFSTFGYVAQGLGGLRSWIINCPHREIEPSEDSCFRTMSIEPCFHLPPYFDCGTKRGTDYGSKVGYVRHCEDLKWGLKLVEHQDPPL
ncbi:galactoside 2-alpha-L-fucosyltransferase-like [Impatiens glandulifera]|uniref:galactoside 2-alpha-L-fucosyltransferase-like n=1 Tax=Impatiens glandulifera TaxID=253017 RepID=UPI001FB0C320|nr:galactoside 2-alpha-L-fucosyltransferase-like [Impatiens glandulifera]